MDISNYLWNRSISGVKVSVERNEEAFGMEVR